VALRPNPKEDRQHYDACELQALSEGPQYHSSEHDRKYPGQDGRQHDDPRAEGQTDEGSDEHEFERQASVQFLDHEGTVAGGDRRQAVTAIL
jgi:hypothetical protein